MPTSIGNDENEKDFVKKIGHKSWRTLSSSFIHSNGKSSANKHQKSNLTPFYAVHET